MLRSTKSSHWRVAISSWLSRASSVAAQLISIPILASLLSTTEFAAYAVIVSLLTWYQLADLGLGSTAQNRIVEQRTKLEEFGTVVAAVAIYGVLMATAAACIIPLLSTLLNRQILQPLKLPQEADSALTLTIAGFLFMGGVLGTISGKILYATQRGVQANMLLLFNNVAFLGILVFFAFMARPSGSALLACVVAYAGPIGISGVVTFCILANQHGIWDRRAIFRTTVSLRDSAVRFWLFAFFSALTLNLDYFIMSQLVPPEQISSYSILFKIFWIPMALYSGLLGAIWPVVTAYGTNGSTAQIRSIVARYAGVGIACVAIYSIAAGYLLPYALPRIAPSLDLPAPEGLVIVLFGVYIALRVWTDTHAVILQALNRFSIMLYVVPLQALISACAQWFLGERFGLPGILAGLIFSFITTVAWVLPVSLRIQLRKIGNA